LNSDINRINNQPSTSVDNKIFEKNLQQVGGQRDLVSKKETDKISGRKDAFSSAPEMDLVDIGKVAQQAGIQTGALQNQALKEMPAAKPAEVSHPSPEMPSALPAGSLASVSSQAPPQGSSSGTATDAANKAKSIQDDLQQANTIFMQMAADRQKWWAQVMKILQDTQTEIFKIWHDTMIYRQKVIDDALAKWGKLLRGEDPFR